MLSSPIKSYRSGKRAWLKGWICVSQPAALSLKLVDPTAIKAQPVDKAGLLRPGRAEYVLWTKPTAPARDWTASIDQAASFGIDAQRIRWITEKAVQAVPQYFLGIRDPFAMASWGLVIAGDGSVIQPAAGVALWRSPDLSAVPGLAMAEGRATAPSDLLGGAQRLREPHLLLHHGEPANFGHWFMDCLPGAATFAKEIGAGQLRLLAGKLTSKQKEILQALDIPSSQITECEGSQVVSCSNLIVPSYLGFQNFYYPSEILLDMAGILRDRATHHTDRWRPRRVYINRFDVARGRIMQNERELMSALDERGFTSLSLGTLSISDQLDLIHDAEFIVGAHGAGMTAVAFAPPGSRVVEILPDRVVPAAWISRLCTLLGHRYAAVVSPVASENLDPIKIEGIERADIFFKYEVDIPAVLRAVDKLSTGS
jgi:capsular polysaccharide biosynthesis protein